MKFQNLFEAESFTARSFEDTDELLDCFAYPGALQDRWVDGLSLRICPRDGRPWVGHFLAGRESRNAASFCCDHPDGIHILVVSRGIGYVVSASNPQDWVELPLRPVMGVSVSVAARSVVLFDYTKMLVLMSDGEKWQTPSLSWDGLKDVEEKEGKILGKGWDAPTGKMVEFEVDIATRKCVGGAAPPAA